jgi:hypothetical protein
MVGNIYMADGGAIGQGQGPQIVFDDTNDYIEITGANVGIGSTAPLSELCINGGLHVGGDSDAGDNNLLVDGTADITGILTAATPTFTGLTTVNQTNGSVALSLIGQKQTKWWSVLMSFSRKGNATDVDGAMESGEELGGFGWKGWDGTVYTSSSYIMAEASQAFTTTAHGTRLRFYVCPNDSVTPAYPLLLDQDSSAKFFGFIKTVGGVHVGGDSDPGADNLLVDGTGTITGGFGCNGAAAQTGYANAPWDEPGAGQYGVDSAAHMAALVELVQDMQAALVANGILATPA